jgi:aryl-alcohol dehydrogenase-like predicted oxidoreductase
MTSDGWSPDRMPRTQLAPGGPVVSRIGLGLAALGRPAYITGGRAGDLPDRSMDGLRAQTFLMLDAAYAAGIRYVDTARSYGRAEEFLGRWLAERDHPDVVAGSKWGYRYTGDWQLDADQHEVKEHSLAMFTAQLAQSRAILGDRLALYQVHSAMLDSPVFTDAGLLAALARLRGEGVLIGLTTSGPHQADTIRRALDVRVGGQHLFTVAQVTWNLLEPSAGPAAAEAASAGWAILVKEAVANGRLTPSGQPPAPVTALAAARGVTEDAIALAAALANPWASVVLSGAVTSRQLTANLAALTVGGLPAMDVAETPDAYWSARSARPWR